MSQREREEPSRILKHLYLGGKVHAKDRDLLRKLNITHVVNCSPPRSVDKNFGIPNYFKKDGDITYLRVPIFDNKGEDITPYLDKVYDFISHGKHYGNILVHCLRGVSRSTSFVMGYLMRDNELSVDEALSHVTMYRSQVQPNDAFLSQLRRYEERLLTERQEESSVQQQSLDVPQQRAQVQVQTQPAASSITACDAKGKDGDNVVSDKDNNNNATNSDVDDIKKVGANDEEVSPLPKKRKIEN